MPAPMKTTDRAVPLSAPLQLRLANLMAGLSDWLMRLNIGADSLDCGVEGNVDCRNQTNRQVERTYPSTTIFGNANLAR